ncbi:hypothetical protein CEE36_09235 [candidate division TA06 bacterium B3_TA06]|uniref:Uncharacterized protein n=1 Tax=candidate division TA06 bacterium B3_TA06 TaxID=2012487 RepID=A0A532V039_UNCT6|nr:MAG: hypothetical protein CEE36_09235 [candidate division TA06 bacterium B3_TA06]
MTWPASMIWQPLSGVSSWRLHCLVWERILEIGCGTVYLRDQIALPERSVIGLGISKWMLREVRKRLVRKNKRASLVLADYYHLTIRLTA